MNEKKTQTIPVKHENGPAFRPTVRGKIAAGALALAGVGAAVAGHEVSQQDSGKDAGPTSFAEVTVSTAVAGEFGGAESDWGHGTAEELLEEALHDGVTKAYASMDVNGDGQPDVSPEEINTIVEELPTYSQASQLLEAARYSEILPDKGDELMVKLQVTADSNKVVTYTIEDSKIGDKANNQE